MIFAVILILLALAGAPLFAIIAASSMWGFHESEIDLSVMAIEIFRIAELPSREQLLGKMLGSVSAPLQGFMNVCQGVSRNLVYVLEGIRKAKEAGA